MTTDPSQLLLRALTVALLPGVPARAQEIPRGEYLTHLPLSAPLLIPQTEASSDLELFGDPSDPGYRDVSPRDGIDDRRNTVLQRLALRFAPYLVQNTDNIPTNFQHFIDNRSSFPLWIDTWDVGGESAELIGTEGVNFSVLGRAECDPGLRGRAFQAYPMPTDDPAVEDCKVLELMDRFTPGGGGVRDADAELIRARPNRFPVLFFNMPGEGEGSWDGVYEREYEMSPAGRKASFPHTFVHPFVHEVVSAGGTSTGYELVLQYWVYYPSNDSGMNHEGDWEHINVVVSPVSGVEQPMSAQTVRRILDGSLPATDDAADPLVIRRVDYYLHHLVMPLDYASPNVYRPRDEWRADVEAREEVRFRERALWREIRYHAYVDDEETIYNTHPLAYIGADNKGLNQALEMPGPSNRDPHASYPFPGRYPNVGPGGTTDEVPHEIDIREHLQAVRNGTTDPGPTFEGGSVLRMAEPDRIRVIPDWERVTGIVRADTQGRRDWAWMVLPIRWGYPATRSPFSGILANVNLGNVAPIGPSYNTAWNVTGAAPGYAYYEPHTLPDILPIQVQDNFRNNLGFLNLTLPVLFNLPPLDFVTRLLVYPFRAALGSPTRVYYPAESLPYRFVGVSSGFSYQKLDDNFSSMSLNARQYEAVIAGLLTFLVESGADDETEGLSQRDFMDESVSPFLNVSFYLGNRIVSDNTLRKVDARYGSVVEFNNIPDFSLSAEFEMWEYSGGIRYLPFDWRFAPYLKGGYGYAWYRIENVRLAGAPLDPDAIDWIGPSSPWPNVWHYGLGIEWVPWRRSGAGLAGLEVGLRAEYARYEQNLDLDLSTIPLEELRFAAPTLGDLPEEAVHRNDFVIALTLTF